MCIRDRAIGDEDRAPRCGESVDVSAFQYAELPGQIGALGMQTQPASYLVDVLLHLLVRQQGRSSEQVGGDAVAYFDLIRFVYGFARLLCFSRDTQRFLKIKIEGASRKRKQQADGEKYQCAVEHGLFS